MSGEGHNKGEELLAAKILITYSTSKHMGATVGMNEVSFIGGGGLSLGSPSISGGASASAEVAHKLRECIDGDYWTCGLWCAIV